VTTEPGLFNLKNVLTSFIINKVFRLEHTDFQKIRSIAKL